MKCNIFNIPSHSVTNTKKDVYTPRTRPLHVPYTPLTHRLHACYTALAPLARLLHALLTRLFSVEELVSWGDVRVWGDTVDDAGGVRCCH